MRTLMLAAMLAVGFAAHAQDAPPPMDPAPADPALRPVLDDFGGREGLGELMDDFMVILLEDPRTQPFFEYTDQAAVKEHLADQFCVILGGDCRYEGRDMRAAHKGMQLRQLEFNALVEDLQIAMERRGIPFRAQYKLLAKLAPMQRDMIEK